MLARKAQGAIAVDMECSAIAALAKFRQINHFQFFYSADNLDSENGTHVPLQMTLTLNQRSHCKYCLKFCYRILEIIFNSSFAAEFLNFCLR